MEIYYSTWPEVELYLKKKKDIIIPVGSTEQHGPTGIIGTDFLSAWSIAKEVGIKNKTMVASPICYGMALHHMAFPGSASLKPSTFIQVVKEVIESYASAGFENFYFINGHGGNIPSLQAAFSECLTSDQKWNMKLFNWWHLPEVTEYENKHFGELNGFHATCGEISVTMATHPEAFQSPRKFKYFKTVERKAWPLGPKEYRKTFPDGRMGSDPRMSTKKHGEKIFNLAIASISKQIAGSK